MGDRVRYSVNQTGHVGLTAHFIRKTPAYHDSNAGGYFDNRNSNFNRADSDNSARRYGFDSGGNTCGSSRLARRSCGAGTDYNLVIIQCDWNKRPDRLGCEHRKKVEPA